MMKNNNSQLEMKWHTMSSLQILNELKTDNLGISESEASERLTKFGLNEIKEEKSHNSFKIIARQFYSPLIIILLVATTISFFLGETIDALIILAIIIFSSVVGFIQEYKSERAIEALKKMTAATVTVIRDGNEKTIRSSQLVPGDIISVTVGDRIPADSYIIEEFDLKTNESSLSGESTPVKKEVCEMPDSTSLADRKNILYTITTVIHGRAKAVVFATGMDTQLGGVAKSVQTIVTEKSPFEKRIQSIGKTLSILMLAVVGAITVIGLFRGFDFLEMFVWGTSLAVAAVPEALPAVVAASLTIGVYKMAKQNAVIRKMPAIETLGSTTVICSDKTGTLTKGEMTVRKILLNNKVYEITGTGYELEGKIEKNDLKEDELVLFGKCSILCNDANILLEGNKVTPIGDPTEVSLVVLGEKLGLQKNKIDKQYPRVSEIQFSSERKRMTTVNKINDEKYAFSKGSTETILNHCGYFQENDKTIPLTTELKTSIIKSTDSFASQGLRVLALAYKKLEQEILPEEIEKDLVFLGLVGMIDPPRSDAIQSVRQCKDAGIRVVMITGDHQLTAESIAKDMGIFEEGTQSITGNEIDQLNSDEFEKMVHNTTVYSRVTSEHKMRIVQSLKKQGDIVAMTGDGINDASALKSADIGIAMGITGTQVTKEAASMILMDDNFASIVSAVKQGRRIIDNVKKYLVYLLPVNIGEIILFAFTVIAGWPIPLLAKHILYVNLATDGSPAIALGMEPAEKDVMKRKPLPPKTSIFQGTASWFFGVSLIIGVTSILLFWYVLETNGWTDLAISKARTMVFVFLVFEEIFFALSCRSLTTNIHKLGLFTNKFLLFSLIGESILILLLVNIPATLELFDLVPLNLHDWLIIMSLAPGAFLYSEILKGVRKSIKKNNSV